MISLKVLIFLGLCSSSTYGTTVDATDYVYKAVDNKGLVIVYSINPGDLHEGDDLLPHSNIWVLKIKGKHLRCYGPYLKKKVDILKDKPLDVSELSAFKTVAVEKLETLGFREVCQAILGAKKKYEDWTLDLMGKPPALETCKFLKKKKIIHQYEVSYSPREDSLFKGLFHGEVPLAFLRSHSGQQGTREMIPIFTAKCKRDFKILTTLISDSLNKIGSTK